MNSASQNIVISQIPEEEEIVNEKRKGTPTWIRWLSQLQLFLNNFFQIYMVFDSIQGNTPRYLFYAPQLTQSDIDALQDLSNGAFIFNSTTGKFNYYQQGVWSELP